MHNKLERRKAMKLLAITRLRAEHTGVFYRIWDAVNRGELTSSAALLAHYQNTAQFSARAGSIKSTPADWFRPDRPRIDKRRRRKATRSGASISVDPGRAGGDFTAICRIQGARVVEIVHDEVQVKWAATVKGS